MTDILNLMAALAGVAFMAGMVIQLQTEFHRARVREKKKEEEDKK